MKKTSGNAAILIAIFSILLFADQLSKFLIRKYSIFISAGRILSMRLIENTGAAFGMLKGYNILLISLSTIILAIVIYFYRKTKDKVTRILIIIFIVGIVGNLADRIILGAVTDFIEIIFWPWAFNLADAYLTTSAILLLIYGK